MPEGPECHKIARRLESTLKSNRVSAFRIHGGRYEKHGPPDGYSDFTAACDSSGGLEVIGVGAHGKLIVMFLSGDWTMLITLGLSGTWSKSKTKHCDVSLLMADGLKMWFKDQLHYGTVRFVRWSTMEKKVLALGPDVTVKDPRFTKKYWRSLIERYRHWDISKLLMDQGKIAGIGNYLKAEILYDSKVAPDSLVGNIPEEYVERLWNSIMELPRHYFILQLTTRFKYGLKVYNKKKDPFGNHVCKMKAGDGRTSHWVPEVQHRFV